MKPTGKAIPIVVERLNGLPRLVIDDGFRMARFFFENDASAGSGAYDEWVAVNSRERFERHDVEVINGTMRARSPYKPWERLYGRKHQWLSRLAPEWDLVETRPEEWASADCSRRICDAIERVSVKRVGRAMATKVLHMKRPRLVPILDGLVIETVGGRNDDRPTPTAEVVDQLRLVARENAAALEDIQGRLTGLAFSPTKVRILDAVLWTAHPKSSLHSRLGWPSHICPPVEKE